MWTVLNFILIVKFEKSWPDESPFLTLDAWRNGMGSQVLRYAHISLCLEVISQYEHFLFFLNFGCMEEQEPLVRAPN